MQTLAHADPTWVSYVNAFSTAAVAVFALVSAWRENRDRAQRYRVARARVAVRLEEQLGTMNVWLQEFPEKALTNRPTGDFDLLAIRRWLEGIIPDFAGTEQSVVLLIDESASGPWLLARGAYNAAASLRLAMFGIRRAAHAAAGENAPVDTVRISALAVNGALLEARTKMIKVLRRARRHPLVYRILPSLWP